MAFNVGDRVRCKTDNGGFIRGDVATVKYISEISGVFSAHEAAGISLSCPAWELIKSANKSLTPTQITELLHEAEHDIFVAEQRKHDLLAVQELVNKGYKVELPDA